MIEYQAQFLKELETLGPYLVKFCYDGSMKEKAYLSNCTVDGPNKRPIILITYDKSTFLINNSQH